MIKLSADKDFFIIREININIVDNTGFRIYRLLNN